MFKKMLHNFFAKSEDPNPYFQRKWEIDEEEIQAAVEELEIINVHKNAIKNSRDLRCEKIRRIVCQYLNRDDIKLGEVRNYCEVLPPNKSLAESAEWFIQESGYKKSLTKLPDQSEGAVRKTIKTDNRRVGNTPPPGKH